MSQTDDDSGRDTVDLQLKAEEFFYVEKGIKKKLEL